MKPNLERKVLGNPPGIGNFVNWYLIKPKIYNRILDYAVHVLYCQYGDNGQYYILPQYTTLLDVLNDISVIFFKGTNEETSIVYKVNRTITTLTQNKTRLLEYRRREMSKMKQTRIFKWYHAGETGEIQLCMESTTFLRKRKFVTIFWYWLHDLLQWSSLWTSRKRHNLVPQ